jgi:hypothetical protein
MRQGTFGIVHERGRRMLMRPPEQYVRHSLKYEKAAKLAKTPRSRKVFLRQAKSWRSLALASLSLSNATKQQDKGGSRKGVERFRVRDAGAA